MEKPNATKTPEESATSKKARELAELIVYATEHYPLVAPMLNSRMHLVKTKFGGVFVAALAACELLAVVFA